MKRTYKIVFVACAIIGLLVSGCITPATAPPPTPTPTPTPSARLLPPMPSPLLVRPQALAQPSSPVQPPLLVSATPTNTGSVTLGWNISIDPQVSGYNLYYGSASATYTTRLDAGNHTICSVSNLVQGATYYFAATAYTSVGLESPFSTELIYTVPIVKKNIVALINTFVETSTNNQFTGWTAITNFPTVYQTNPPSLLFYRTRVTIDYISSP